MKKLLWLFVYISFAKIAFSQSVHFPDSNAVWALDFVGPQIHLVGGDTTINNISYKKYFATNDTTLSIYGLYGFLREDTLTKKIYGFTTTTTVENLLYDFSANVGDTVTVFSYCWGSYGNLVVKVAAIDSILLQGQYRKRLQVVNLDINNNWIDEYWIEGIGSTCGLFYSGISGAVNFQTGGLGVPALVCFHQNNMLVYDSPFFMGCYPNVGVGLQSTVTTMSIQAFPNPANDKVYFSNLAPGFTISIYNCLGQLQQKKINPENPEIDLALFPKGLYSYVITDSAQNLIAVNKFIKE